MTIEEINESAVQHLLSVLGDKSKAIEVLAQGIIQHVDDDETLIEQEWVIAQLNFIRFINTIDTIDHEG